MKRLIAATLAAALASGCATTHTGAQFAPIVDLKDRDPVAYSTDLQQCQQYAQQQDGAAAQAIAGALVGAAFGALISAAAGPGYSRNSGAGVGLVTGLASGAASGENDQRSVIRRCLTGRGYSILN